MNDRERVRAILHYESYDRLPLVHFGFWRETLQKWASEGHLTTEEADGWADGNLVDAAISSRLGFDFNWYHCFQPKTRLFPPIEERVVRRLSDGSRHVLNSDAVIVVQKDGATGIPTEVEHLLKGRTEWEETFLPRLQYSEERIRAAAVQTVAGDLPFGAGGLEYLQRAQWDRPYGLHCGSLYGAIRNWLGLVGSSYLQADDPALFDEIIETVGQLCYECTRQTLEWAGGMFDFAHFWEDICYNHGPLINPRTFREKVGPHYRRITQLVRSYGIDIVSLDCDGKIDALVPIWLENGVNTMFPMEVGTWEASLRPWREAYGRELRGVGGMNKTLFARDYAAVDAEIERLKPLVALGGYIPCPDHRLAPDAEWENVRYYADQMRRAFG